MNDAEIWAVWRVWLLVGAAVVLVAAALLVTIWLTARSIAAHARRALAALETIRENTRAIWELQTTNELGRDLQETVRDIEAKSTALVEALDRRAAAGGRRRSEA